MIPAPSEKTNFYHSAIQFTAKNVFPLLLLAPLYGRTAHHFPFRIRVGAHSWDYTGKPFIKRLDRCSFIYTRRDPALTGLNYKVWTSTNLTDWIEDIGALQTPGTPGPDEVQTVDVALRTGLLINPSLFVQVRAASGL